MPLLEGESFKGRNSIFAGEGLAASTIRGEETASVSISLLMRAERVGRNVSV